MFQTPKNQKWVSNSNIYEIWITIGGDYFDAQENEDKMQLMSISSACLLSLTTT
jgi:hypothetical protein